MTLLQIYVFLASKIAKNVLVTYRVLLVRRDGYLKESVRKLLDVRKCQVRIAFSVTVRINFSSVGPIAHAVFLILW